jgi:hypothetical protein
VDGFLDWYWLGVLLGLGVADGVIGREVRRPLLGTASLALFGASIVIAFLALEWWAFLSPAARLVAALAAAAIAFIPALGYALAVGAPIAGVRLSRRASSRFAGLRVLAKD